MAEEIITSTNAETATDHEYNASEIQVLKGLEAVRKLRLILCRIYSYSKTYHY